MSKAGMGRTPWNKNTKGKMKSWNKGLKLSQRTEEEKKNISETLKNFWQSAKGIKQRAKLSERFKNNKFHTFRKKRLLSEKTKQKISEAHRKRNEGKILLTPLEKLIRKSIKYQEWRQSCFVRDNFTCQTCKKRGGVLHVHHKKSFRKWLVEVKLNLPFFSLFEGAMIYSPIWDIDNGITLCKECHELTRNYGHKARKQ